MSAQDTTGYTKRTGSGRAKMSETNSIVFYILTGFTPSMVALLGYIIRMERSMAKIKTNICWIKKELEKCPPS